MQLYSSESDHLDEEDFLPSVLYVSCLVCNGWLYISGTRSLKREEIDGIMFMNDLKNTCICIMIK